MKRTKKNNKIKVKNYKAKLKKVIKTIEKYKKLNKKQKKSKYFEARKEKIKLLTRQKNIYKNVITKKKLTDKQLKNIKEINFKLKYSYKLKKPKIDIEKPVIEKILEQEFLDLQEKYATLLYGSDAFARGILKALQKSGLLPNNIKDINVEQLRELDNMLEIAGLTWQDIANIIDSGEYNKDVSEMYYDDNERNIKKEKRVFSGDYFGEKLTDLIEKIAKEKGDAIEQGDPDERLYGNNS